mgnify:CR=1 FL=1
MAQLGDFVEVAAFVQLPDLVAVLDRIVVGRSFAPRGFDFGDDGVKTTLDGIRVDFADGWGLCRASNTTPMLVLRFEADTQEELERIQDVFRNQLHKVAPDLQLPF